MALRDTFRDYGFHLQMPLCNRCIHRRQKSFDEDGAALGCEIFDPIPAELLSCQQDDCDQFVQDDQQAALFKGII